MLNFKISELIKSDEADKYRIDNTPDSKALDNMLELIFYCAQPIRNLIKKPMVITSGYRCAKLNELVRGAKNSQHLKGQAIDFVVPGMTIQQVIDFIVKSGVEYDQIINEHDAWVHLSYVKGRNRKQPSFKIG